MYFHFFFFFNDTATTEIYTLSLHDALPIYRGAHRRQLPGEDEQHRRETAASQQVTVQRDRRYLRAPVIRSGTDLHRSEEHTSELQSPCNLVCRLLLEKKKHSIIKRRHS